MVSWQHRGLYRCQLGLFSSVPRLIPVKAFRDCRDAQKTKRGKHVFAFRENCEGHLALECERVLSRSIPWAERSQIIISHDSQSRPAVELITSAAHYIWASVLRWIECHRELLVYNGEWQRGHVGANENNNDNDNAD